MRAEVLYRRFLRWREAEPEPERKPTPGPVPTSLEDARSRVVQVAAAQAHDMTPPHFPADPVISLCQLTLDLIERVEALESRHSRRA